MTEREMLALGGVSTREGLRKRINYCRSVLKHEYRQKFRKYILDMKNKRAVTEDGRYAIQWLLRLRPDLPESYNNQQTNLGVCIVTKLAA